MCNARDLELKTEEIVNIVEKLNLEDKRDSITNLYGDTLWKVIQGVDVPHEALIKLIQKQVSSLPDGKYGPNTADAIIEYLPAIIASSHGASTTTSNPSRSSTYDEVFLATPNVSTRSIRPEGVVLHHSWGSYTGSVDWILNDKSDVSYHCIIDLNGSRTVFARDTQRAWHAGRSIFRGRTGCNDFMLGLAFSQDTNKRRLTAAEIESAIEWLVSRYKRWGWPRDLSTLTTHRAVSPGRKNDVDVRAENDIRNALSKALS